MCLSSSHDHMAPLHCVECWTYNGYHILGAYIQSSYSERMMSFNYKLHHIPIKYKCPMEESVHIKCIYAYPWVKKVQGVHHLSMWKPISCPPRIKAFHFPFHTYHIYIEEKNWMCINDPNWETYMYSLSPLSRIRDHVFTSSKLY